MNPYELRFNMLLEAHKITHNGYKAELEKYHALNEQGEYPTYPSTQDLFKTADEIKSFVNDTGED